MHESALSNQNQFDLQFPLIHPTQCQQIQIYTQYQLCALNNVRVSLLDVQKFEVDLD